MLAEIAKDKIRLNQKMGQKNEIINIDGDVIVNDVKPDILKVLDTNGVVCIYKREILNGKVKIEGQISIYIIYLADDEDGNIRTINTSLDFAEIIDIDNCKEGMTLEDNIFIKGFETKIINGRKLHLKAYLNFDLSVYSNTETQVIVNVENSDSDIQVLNYNKSILSLIGTNVGKTTLKDTINIDKTDEIAEIMKISFSFSNTETKTSYNKVLIKSEANIGIMYLTVNNNIKIINAKIPVMGFTDLPDVTDTSVCIPRINLKNLILRQGNDEENSIYIEADLDLLCRAYQERKLNIIEDIYSISNSINLDTEVFNMIKGEENIKDTIEIRQKTSDQKLMYENILTFSMIPEIQDTIINDGKISYKGQLNTNFIVKNENNIDTIDYKFPFEFEITSNDVNERSNIETEIDIITSKIENNDDGINLTVQMGVNVNVQNNEKLTLIKDISFSEQEKQDNDRYSMIIYFVKPGDTLWNIAKQFRSKVEDIARVNEIEDENKIYPGQQLYIPKYTRNRIVV